MASLYELTGEVMYLQELLEAEVIDEGIFNDTLESLDIETKVENICKVIRNLEADAEAFKKEKDRLAARQKAAENGVKRLKESLLNYMLVTNKPSVKAGSFKVSTGSSEKVIVTNPVEISENYLTYLEPKIDLTGIKKAIKSGEVVLGAELVKSPYVTIR